VKSTLLTGALCLTIGLAVGAILSGRAPDRTTFQMDSTTQVLERDGSQAMSRAELAAVVREELARERAAGGHAGAAAPGAGDAPQTADEARESMSAEEVDHAERAGTVVDAALARGAWTEADKLALWNDLGRVPAPVQVEILSKLGTALNAGQLRLETDGMPL